MIDRDDDEIWLVYESSYLLCVVDSETKAEGICFAYEYRNWQRFVTPTEETT
jgi:hypothetical protein